MGRTVALLLVQLQHDTDRAALASLSAGPLPT